KVCGECLIVIVDFIQDEPPRLRRIAEHVEALAAGFALKRGFRVGGDQIAKSRNKGGFHKKFNEHDKRAHDPPKPVPARIAPLATGCYPSHGGCQLSLGPCCSVRVLSPIRRPRSTSDRLSPA